MIMTKRDKKSLRANLVASLQFAVSDSYVMEIADALLDDVAEDIDVHSGKDYSSEDVKRSVGRILCWRLGMKSEVGAKRDGK